MTVNFSDLLKERTGDVKAPSPLPIGTYRALVVAHSTGTSSKKGTPFVQFTVKIVEPCADVDEDDFNAYGGMATLKDKTFDVPYYLSERARFMLANFITSLGLPDDKTLGENIANIVGAEVNAKVQHELDENSNQVFARIRNLSGDKESS